LCPKPILLALATLFGLQLLAEPASTDAQPAPAQPEPAQPEPARPAPARLAPTALNATVQDGEIIGNEQRRRVFMNVGGRRLMLAVPQGFRAVNANPEKIVLVNRDYSCVLSFRIAAPGSATAASLNAELCRGWLSAQLDDLKIQEEFSLTAANQSGPAFEVSYNADGVSRSSQVAFIPSPVGVLEFSLASSPEVFQAAKSDFRGLLRCFRISDADGKLEILPAQGGT
jgi:hypothetical protein